MSKKTNQPKGAQYYGKEDDGYRAAWYKKEGETWMCLLDDGKDEEWDETYMNESRFNELVRVDCTSTQSQQNQVRPRMSRENYEWLKSIEGETNDERIENLKMSMTADAIEIKNLELELKESERRKERLVDGTNKLFEKLADSHDKLDESTTIIENLNQCLDITGKEKIRMKSERDTFIVYLCVSMVVNFGLLGYIATLQGWF